MGLAASGMVPGAPWMLHKLKMGTERAGLRFGFPVDYRRGQRRADCFGNRGSIRNLPGSFNAKGVEIGSFFFVKVVLDELVDAAAARAPTEAGAQFGQIFDRT